MKGEKARHEHGEDDGASGDVKIPPAFVHRPRAACFSWCRDIAGIQIGITRIFVTCQEAPSD